MREAVKTIHGARAIHVRYYAGVGLKGEAWGYVTASDTVFIASPPMLPLGSSVILDAGQEILSEASQPMTGKVTSVFPAADQFGFPPGIGVHVAKGFDSLQERMMPGGYAKGVLRNQGGIMQPSLLNKRGADRNRWAVSSLPTPALKELAGATCGVCGSRHYYLVLCATARTHQAELTARCSRCHEPRQGLSEGRLIQDVERAASLQPAGFPEWRAEE